MKVFFDTNVLIAGCATRGSCADLFAHVLLEHDLVVGEVVPTALRTNPGLGITDPDDDWEIASAPAGGADVLVTGDAAVPKLGKRAPLPILSPRGFLERLRGPEPRRWL